MCEKNSVTGKDIVDNFQRAFKVLMFYT